MEKNRNLTAVYAPSEDVVAREVQGEFIIIPVTSNVLGEDEEDALLSLNESGRAVWDKFDGKRSMREIVDSLSSEFDGTRETMEKDVLGLIAEFKKRRMVIQQ